jgi:hypothetical protein
MYAAAGNTVRNARKRQQEHVVKEKQAAEKAAKKKLEAEKLAELNAHPRSRHFHQLPDNYLRAQHPYGRKLSAGYTGNSSKLLLPISEQSAQHHSPSQLTLHHPSRHQHHNYTNEPPRTPTHKHRDLRLDVEHHKMPRSATASQLHGFCGTPPASPGICFRQQQHFFKQSQSNLLSAHHPIHIQIPNANNDGIIITPATPLPSPSPSASNHRAQEHQRNDTKAAANDDDMQEFPLERTCSVYRNRKLEANEPTAILDIDDEQQHQQFYPGGLPNGNGGHHTHWADEFYDAENRALGVCPCDHIEVKLMSSFCLLFFFHPSFRVLNL